MFSILARLVGGAVSPAIERMSAAGANLARKVALFLVAAICFVVVAIALTVAFDLWIASLAGAIVGALAVAGLYLALGAIAVVLALQSGATRRRDTAAAAAAAAAPEPGRNRSAQVDRFIAPLLKTLQALGLRREQIAVLAGASVAKQIGPIPLVGLAIVAGFLIGRLWKGWRGMMSTDLVATILSLVGASRAGQAEPQDQSA